MICKCVFKNTSPFLWFIEHIAATFATRCEKREIFQTNSTGWRGSAAAKSESG